MFVCIFYLNRIDREKSIDKFAYAYDAYERHVGIILSMHEDEIPVGLTKEIMMQKSLSSQSILTGKQIWETIWETMNTYVTNKMLVKWMEVRPMTKNGAIKSGVENFEPVLLDLRKKLFDLEKNSIPLIQESSPKQAPSSVNDGVVQPSAYEEIPPGDESVPAKVTGGDELEITTHVENNNILLLITTFWEITTFCRNIKVNMGHYKMFG